MPDIFGRVDQQFGGALSADAMYMVWPDLPADGAGLLVQNVSLQYAQPVRRIFELGPGAGNTQYTYYIVGRPEGTFQIARIVGLKRISIEFYLTYGNPCNETPNFSLSAGGGCNGVDNAEGSLGWDLSGVILTGIGMNASAQEMIIQENVAGMFIKLEIN